MVLEGEKLRGKSLREHFEVINHRDAIIYIEMLAKKNESVSEALIKRSHHILSKNIDNTNAGKYRNININFTESDHEPPHFNTMTDEMARLIVCHNENLAKMHPVEVASRIHADLIKIHPFIDGNGRTARLLMNLELIKSGFPPAVIPATLKKEYFETLDKAHMHNDYEPFIGLVADALEQSFEIFLDNLNMEMIE
ncbi:Fic family protein [Desulforegula conservatrix]|uniref:Fic family protein n=1 Tax=Desulforegula conservatrix TaxID=153026 RepID=UPI0018DBD506|nr:Fic family protein [Desulforegula conservatrix]